MRILLTALAACMLLTPAAADAASAKRHRCKLPPGSYTVAADLHARIVASDAKGYPGLFACRYRTGRVRELPIEGADWTDVELAWPYVAYSEFQSSSAVSEYIQRVNLRSGRWVTVADLGRQGSSGEMLWDFVLSDTGAVAWTAVSAYDNSAYLEKRDADGRAKLDTSPGIDQDSLALSNSGRRVYWMRAGAPQSARLR